MDTSVDASLTSPVVRRDGTLGRWVVRCAAAEAIGMTAAAAAARYADSILVDRSTPVIVLAGACILLAGLVEGTALGYAQAGALRRLLPGLRVGRFVVATVALAGVGWAAGSIPSLTADPSAGSDSGPPWPVLLLLGGLMGATMGGLLGAGQAYVLRKHSNHPWRWVSANVAAWTPAMALLMLGAGLPSADWPVPVVLVWAMATGALAGATLGLVLGWFSSSLVGARARDRMVLAALRSGRPRRLTRSLVGLRLTGRRTHRLLELPVMYAEDGDGLWIIVGQADRKQWWRNVEDQPVVEVLRDREWRAGLAEVVAPGEPGFDAGLSCYRQRWPRTGRRCVGPLVRIVLVQAATPQPGPAAD